MHSLMLTQLRPAEASALQPVLHLQSVLSSLPVAPCVPELLGQGEHELYHEPWLSL